MRSLWISFNLTGVYRDIQHDMVGGGRGGVKGEEFMILTNLVFQAQFQAGHCTSVKSMNPLNIASWKS